MGPQTGLTIAVLVAGSVVVAAIFSKAALERLGLPSLVGYMALGLVCRGADDQWHFLSDQAGEVFRFLADLGVIALLFRVGLESKLRQLRNQLGRASFVWISDVTVSGALGFVAAYFLLGLARVPSLIVASALTATSVGMSSSVWREADAIGTPRGQLFVDVAEMDDISGVVVMALLFALLPTLMGQEAGVVGAAVARTAGLFAVKLLGFGLFCVLFSLYVEHPITRFVEKLERSPDPMLAVTGMGIIIAAVAGLLGFSVAIGAFFAGLAYSRDPDAVKMTGSFDAVHDLFCPFFFFGIGLQMSLESMFPALLPAVVLCVAALAGKLIGAGGPAALLTGWQGAALLGVSMVPRAEIAMIIMQRGLRVGESVVPQRVFSAMVMVSAATCLAGPIALHWLLGKWATTRRGSEA